MVWWAGEGFVIHGLGKDWVRWLMLLGGGVGLGGSWSRGDQVSWLVVGVGQMAHGLGAGAMSVGPWSRGGAGSDGSRIRVSDPCGSWSKVDSHPPPPTS